jgi:hypothetical protein
MKLFSLHEHAWGKWTIVKRYNLLRPSNTKQGEDDIVGGGFIQERTCAMCGKTEIDRQETRI